MTAPPSLQSDIRTVTVVSWKRSIRSAPVLGGARGVWLFFHLGIWRAFVLRTTGQKFNSNETKLPAEIEERRGSEIEERRGSRTRDWAWARGRSEECAQELLRALVPASL